MDEGDKKQSTVGSLKKGNYVIIDEVACTVRDVQTSRPGKHGHAKCRIEAAHMVTGNKKVFVTPGHERFEVPMVNKNKAQILSIAGDVASVMDLTSFETIDVSIPEDLKGQLSENENVEYWEIEDTLILKRQL